MKSQKLKGDGCGMKTLKQHIKDTELDDFEEDLMSKKT